MLDEIDKMKTSGQYWGFEHAHPKALSKMEHQITDKALTLTMNEFEKLYAAHPNLKSAAAAEMTTAVQVEKDLGRFSAIDKHRLSKPVTDEFEVR